MALRRLEAGSRWTSTSAGRPQVDVGVGASVGAVAAGAEAALTQEAGVVAVVAEVCLMPYIRHMIKPLCNHRFCSVRRCSCPFISDVSQEDSHALI